MNTNLHYLVGLLLLIVTQIGFAQSEQGSDQSEIKIPFEMREDNAHDMPGVTQYVGTIVLGLSLAIGVLLVLKKTRFKHTDFKLTDAQKIQLISAQKLTTKATVHLVSIEGQKYVIVCGDNGVICQVHHTTDSVGENESK